MEKLTRLSRLLMADAGLWDLEFARHHDRQRAEWVQDIYYSPAGGGKIR
jgi:hypothetical protein